VSTVRAERWAAAGAVALLLLLVAYPMATVAGQAFFPHAFARHPSWAFDPLPLLHVFTRPWDYRMLADSCLLSAAAALLATCCGTALAILTRRTDVPARALWAGLVWVVLLTPSFLLAQGWELLLQRGGLLDSLLAVPPLVRHLFFSPWGLALVLAGKFFPFAYLAVGAALPWLGGEQEAAARVLGAGRGQAWRRIYLPLLLPFLASGATLVFADVLSDFGIAATVAQSAHFPLLTYQIYAALYTVPTDYPGAGALALLLTAAVGGALLVQLALLRRYRYATVHGGFRPPPPIPLGRARPLAAAALGLFFAAALGAPLAASLLVSFLTHLGAPLALGSLTLAHYAAVLRGGSQSLGALFFSLRLAAVAATAAVLLGSFLAWAGIQGSGAFRAALQGISLWIISLPGIVLAAGYIFAWNQRWLAAAHLLLYGTAWALVLAYLAGGLPYVLRLQLGAMTQLDQRLVAAARVQGAGVAALLRRVILPLLADGSLSLWLFVLAGTAFELPASELLYPPGQPTLAVEILHRFDGFAYGRGTALTALAAAAVLGLVLVAHLGLRRRITGAPRAERQG
jgi:iron(III) transport system permease protein